MNNGSNIQKLSLQGETGGLEKGALVCDGIMLAIFLWNQLRYGMNMMFLIAPLTLIGVFLFAFGVTPETYCFTENGLEIIHKYRKTKRIGYDTVFNFEASARDSFINITNKNLVKVYYTAGRKKCLAVCRPCDVESFVEALKANCCELQDTAKNSRLDVFFRHNESEKGDL